MTDNRCSPGSEGPSQSVMEMRERPFTATVAELPELLARYADAIRSNIDTNPQTVANYLDRAAAELSKAFPDVAAGPPERCHVCGWNGGGARDEGCLLPEYKCPRSPAQATPGRHALAAMLKESGFCSRDGTVVTGGTLGVVDAILSALSSTNRGGGAE
jgi:hypothetical protein